MKNIFSECCEEEELSALESELPLDEFELLTEGELETDEEFELAGLEEEMLMEESLETLSLEGGLMGEDVELAAAEGEFPAEEQLEFAGIEEAGIVSLEEVFSVLKKYPGLKITFSF